MLKPATYDAFSHSAQTGERMFKVAIGLLSVAVGIMAAAKDGKASDAACSNALVVSTYNSFDYNSLDWRLAIYVTREAYEQIKTKANGSAVIYGFPTGGSGSNGTESSIERARLACHGSGDLIWLSG